MGLYFHNDAGSSISLVYGYSAPECEGGVTWAKKGWYNISPGGTAKVWSGWAGGRRFSTLLMMLPDASGPVSFLLRYRRPLSTGAGTPAAPRQVRWGFGRRSWKMTSRPRSWITPSTSFRETKTDTREKAAGWIGREENPAKPAYFRPAGPRIPTTKSKAARFYLVVTGYQLLQNLIRRRACGLNLLDLAGQC